jgi:hypothetical protein
MISGIFVPTGYKNATDPNYQRSLPATDNRVNTLLGATIFPKIDLERGYHLVPIGRVQENLQLV